MQDIIDNIRALLPAVAIIWLILIIMVWRKPQRMRNCIVLMIAVFITLLFLAGCFGDYMREALMGIAILICLALLSVPVILIANGLQMMKRERKSVGNMLSLFLGIFVAVGEICLLVLVIRLGLSGKSSVYDKGLLFIGLTVFYFSCFVLAFVLYSLFIGIVPARKNFDYVVVHGCGLIHGTEVSKLLASRLDKALAVCAKSKTKPIIIPSGGKGPGEEITEAEAMKKYLLEKGFPEERIVMEDRSTTTMENLQYSRAIIYQQSVEQSDAAAPDAEFVSVKKRKKEIGKVGRNVALISSNYHVYRCLLLSRDLGLNCTGIGAPVAWYYWPSALIREFVAVFTKLRFLIWMLAGYVLLIIVPMFILG